MDVVYQNRIPVGSLTQVWYLRPPTAGPVFAWPRVVYVCHGSGYPYDDPWSVSFHDTRYDGAWHPLIDGGYHLCVPAMGGDLFGNDDALALLLTAHDGVAQQLGDHDVYLYGISMGAVAAGRAAAGRGGFPTPAAVATVDGLLVLSTVATNTSYQAAWPNGSTGESPEQIDPVDYGAVPFLCSASPADTTVKKALNTDVFAAHLGAQVQVLATTGLHVIAAHFTADAKTFFDLH